MTNPTLETFKAMLFVDKHGLDDALEVQAELMDRISTEVVRSNTLALDAKDSLLRVEAKLMEQVREEEGKISAAAAEAWAKRRPERIRAWDAYQGCREEHEAWQGLLDAWRQRGYSIKTLADLYAANYFTPTSTHSIHDPAPRQRAAIREASQHVAAHKDSLTRRRILNE